MRVGIDTREIERFKKTLGALHKSAFPVAVRSALNSTAFHVKQQSMPEEAKKAFVNRRANFFKANSKVEMAKGFNVKSMRSIVGFKSTGRANKAVEELQQQEFGGRIRGRSFISMRTARVGKSDKKNVRPGDRLSAIAGGRVVNSARGKGSRKQNYVRAAFRAVTKYGPGRGYVLGSVWNGQQVMYRVEEIWGSTRGSGLRSSRKIWIKVTPLYTYKDNRTVPIKRTSFMKNASLKAGAKMDAFFRAAAEKQLVKYGAKL